jgi:hypothetical protein
MDTSFPPLSGIGNPISTPITSSYSIWDIQGVTSFPSTSVTSGRMPTMSTLVPAYGFVSKRGKGLRFTIKKLISIYFW